VLASSILDRLLTVGIPIPDKIARTFFVYVFIFLLLRLFGRRTAAQLNTFDLVVLLLLSNVVQNAIIGPDDSLLGGLIGAIALTASNEFVVRVVRRSDRIDRWIEGNKTRLAEMGEFMRSAMVRLGIRQNDLEVAIRRQGAENVKQVKTADLYPSGAIVVDMHRDAHDATFSDVERLERKVDAVLAAITGSSGPHT
jgi:uncharacterized membrane protein YcaP (DUF421 family)